MQKQKNRIHFKVTEDLNTKLIYKGKKVISVNAFLDNGVPKVILLERVEGQTEYSNFKADIGYEFTEHESPSPFKNIMFTYPSKIECVVLGDNPTDEFLSICATIEEI